MGVDFTPIILSLKVAITAVFFVVLCGIPLAGLMARRDFPGKDALEALFTLPLVLPPSVVDSFFFGCLARTDLWSISVHTFNVSVVFHLSGL